jgi:hypothetical protein
MSQTTPCHYVTSSIFYTIQGVTLLCTNRSKGESINIAPLTGGWQKKGLLRNIIEEVKMAASVHEITHQ